MQSFIFKIVNSALWAAYGDSLGFITELAVNASVVKSRIGSATVGKTVPWTRRIGGKFGADCELPSGCYSDDTQLRLSTSRAIRSDGSFDVEAFAKIELPVWTSYALGAGRGSKAAASALARDGVNWFSNFFNTQGTSYIQGGGNGGAMRIQPHVWSMHTKSDQKLLIEGITKNSICTHGHARGILGAVFHGLCLRHVLLNNSIPGYNDCGEIIQSLDEVAYFVENDPDLRLFWLPIWEQNTGMRFRDACLKVKNEMHLDISILASIPSGNPEVYYKNAVESLGALDERERGSATKTALLAVALSFAFGPDSIENGLLAAANLLGSDTDSIASMAGALLGCISERKPEHDILDRQYITKQAERMAKIALGEPVDHIQYPDLMKWNPPKTQQDSVIAGESGLEVLLLGKVVVEGDTFSTPRSDAGVWQWLSLESGQTILAKRKKIPSIIKNEKLVTIKSIPIKHPIFSHQVDPAEFDFLNNNSNEASVDELTKQAIRSGFDPLIIGQHILLLSVRPEGIEKTIAYAAIIAKARIARNKA